MADIKKIRNYLPYLIAWKLKHKNEANLQIDFYCDNVTDYICFKKILGLSPQIRVVVKDRKLQKALESLGVITIIYPSYPDVVIMCRHSTWRYPLQNIIKIGMRHGPYHFKDFIKAKSYNEFDLFLFTSPTEAIQAQYLGIKNGVGVGFPKLDDAFDGSITSEQLNKLRHELGFKSDKPTIIFSATWSKSNYSAILKWYDKLDLISENYNILVTVHEWTPESIKSELKNNHKIHYIEDKNILPYLMIADLMVGDISSIIAEFTALDKPVITYRIPIGGRISSEIVDMLDEITYRVDTFEEMYKTIEKVIDGEDIHQVKRKFYNDKMFGELDGKASLRAKEEIDRTINKLISKSSWGKPY
ncbi:CDP-glycerol glycerophosphotransferase family protein [bacterium]|nr:CDP-glycerol glycerophosphotransferase family protein [bacterium]